ncbi:hypothetical protein MKEN_00059700 [Mycena kentingensis (nom. inval.)]|nr:hypothetical protein MKEN_00059700 [Mycena kentingensis (nom. inval.)]
MGSNSVVLDSLFIRARRSEGRGDPDGSCDVPIAPVLVIAMNERVLRIQVSDSMISRGSFNACYRRLCAGICLQGESSEGTVGVVCVAVLGIFEFRTIFKPAAKDPPTNFHALRHQDSAANSRKLIAGTRSGRDLQVHPNATQKVQPSRPWQRPTCD